MDKFRSEFIELIVAVETEDPRTVKIIDRIKGGFNSHMEFKYGEALRRGKEAQEKREASK